MVLAVCECDVVAADCVLSAGLTVVIITVSVLAVRDSRGVSARITSTQDIRRLTTIMYVCIASLERVASIANLLEKEIRQEFGVALYGIECHMLFSSNRSPSGTRRAHNIAHRRQHSAFAYDTAC